MTEKKTNKAKINYFVDLIIAVGFVLTAVSGLVLFFAGSGGYQEGRNPRYAREALLWSRKRAEASRTSARNCPVEG